MRLVVDSELCMGAGQCVLIAEDLFTLEDDEGTVVVLVPVPAPDRLELARDAVDSCPAAALALVSDE